MVRCNSQLRSRAFWCVEYRRHCDGIVWCDAGVLPLKLACLTLHILQGLARPRFGEICPQRPSGCELRPYSRSGQLSPVASDPDQPKRRVGVNLMPLKSARVYTAAANRCRLAKNAAAKATLGQRFTCAPAKQVMSLPEPLSLMQKNKSTEPRLRQGEVRQAKLPVPDGWNEIYRLNKPT